MSYLVLVNGLAGLAMACLDAAVRIVCQLPFGAYAFKFQSSQIIFVETLCVSNHAPSGVPLQRPHSVDLLAVFHALFTPEAVHIRSAGVAELCKHLDHVFRTDRQLT
jgi:hypothetical protein